MFPQPRKTLAPILIYRPTHRHHMDLFISPNPEVKRLSRNNCSQLMSMNAFSPELHQISRGGECVLVLHEQANNGLQTTYSCIANFQLQLRNNLIFSNFDSTALLRTNRTSDITDRTDMTEVVRVAFKFFRCFILTLTQISLISFTLNQILTL